MFKHHQTSLKWLLYYWLYYTCNIIILQGFQVNHNFALSFHDYSKWDEQKSSNADGAILEILERIVWDKVP